MAVVAAPFGHLVATLAASLKVPHDPFADEMVQITERPAGVPLTKLNRVHPLRD